MTREELGRVRRIKEELKAAQERLENLRSQRGSLQRVISGGRGKRLTSRVMELATEIIEAENAAEVLRAKLLLAQDYLVERIYTEIRDAKLQEVLYWRYVECESLRATARKVHMSVTNVVRKIEEYIKKERGGTGWNVEERLQTAGEML